MSEALPSILAHVMMDGEEVGTRQGERSKEILMPRIALWRPWEREVLVPGRKASLPAQIAETMWVLAGRNDVEWLSHYLPRAAEFSDDGKVWRGGYGPRLRRWDVTDTHHKDLYLDQIEHVVRLLNNERGTRRAVMSIYDPALDSPQGKDIPCNNWISFISRLGKLHMNVATRSNDVMWGWSGINQFEWSVLQEIVAHLTGNQIGTLTFNVTSMHVYEKHWDKALKIVDKDPVWAPDLSKPSPRFDLDNRSLGRLDDLIQSWFMIEAMIRSGDPAEFHVDGFPEPMMQSWLRVIQWYWCRNDNYLDPINGTRLWTAAMMSPKRKPTAAEQAVLNNPHVSEAIKETFQGGPDGYLVSPPGPHQVGDVVDVVPVKVTAVHRDKNTVEVTGEVPPNLAGLFETVKGMSINEDIKVKPMTPAQIAAGPLFDNSTRPVTVQDIDALEDKVLKSPVIWSSRDKVTPLAWTAQFVEFVDNLHREKSAVYGDSWKRRGEQMAILANIARKVDRLGEGGAGDTAADTVIDLLVYLAKYALWLNEQDEAYFPAESDENEFVLGVLQSEDRRCVKVVQHASIPPRIVALKEFFEQLTILVQTHEIGNALQARMEIVDHMISLAFPTARYFWGVENGHILSQDTASELFGGTVEQTADYIRGVKADNDRKWAELNAARRWEGYESEGENID